ncbi:hypothetical protein C3L33_21251, partial [Rhododendron williamsianum]
MSRHLLRAECPWKIRPYLVGEAGGSIELVAIEEPIGYCDLGVCHTGTTGENDIRCSNSTNIILADVRDE